MTDLRNLLSDTAQSHRLAHIVWSTLCEPADPMAGALRKHLGAQEALRWVAAEKPDFGALAHLSSVDEQSAAGGREPQQEESQQGVPVLSRDSGRYKQSADLAVSPGPEISAAGVGLQTWKRRHCLWQQRLVEGDVNADLERMKKLGGHVICPLDPQWPSALDHLGVTEPSALWVLGALQPLPLYSQSVSVIGARACTAYGKETAANFAYEAAAQGITVVSGGAYGIDAAAHKGALAAQGATVVVLCGGVGRPYPQAHAGLFSQIVSAGGAVLSEVPPHWRPARWRFLERNRIIAALSAVTLVVEAGMRSGALATAHRALELGREVAVVPGPITSPVSAGCNHLICEGAALASQPEHVAELLGASAQLDCVLGGFVAPKSDVAQEQRLPKESASPAEVVIGLLDKKTPLALVDLEQQSGIALPQLQVRLGKLQLQGRVKKTSQGWIKTA